MLNTTKSEELYKVALDLMPGGVNSPVRAFGAVGKKPFYLLTMQRVPMFMM